jgi:hypothetical protein
MTSPASLTDYVPRYSRRILYLSERCFNFINGIKSQHPTWNLEFDPLVMTNVGISAMDDIWRWKVYHLADSTKRADAVKRAAFFTKWILKLRPIYFQGRTPGDFLASFDKNDITLLVNEIFALHVARASLANEARVPKILPSPVVAAELLYDFHYRTLGEDALMHIYQMLRSTAEGKPILTT